jgi:predicted TPR repeat methyltransferase
VFTVEALPDGAAGRLHILQANGRYAHAQDYIQCALTQTGFEAAELRRVTLRHEAGQPVPGLVVAARRP